MRRRTSLNLVVRMNTPSIDAATVISQQLTGGERLVWSGRPRGGIRFRGADIFFVPFSLIWCSFAIFWEVMASAPTAAGHGRPGNVAFVFPIFGVPFVLVGLYFVFGRFLADARMRAKTCYGVTNERIVIVSQFFGKRVKSLNLRTLNDITLSERGDGSGVITFGPTQPYGRWAASWPGAGQYASPSFDFIENAKEVYDTIRRTQRSSG